MTGRFGNTMRWLATRRYTTFDTFVLCAATLSFGRSYFEGFFVCVVGTLLSKYIEYEVSHA
jgi:hypothetical protein